MSIDRPAAAALLDALADFLGQDVVRALPEALRFKARIAANVARICAREALATADREAERARLAELLATDGDCTQLNRLLVEHIRRGDFDREPDRTRLFAHFRATVAADLRVNAPTYGSSADAQGAPPSSR